MAAAMSPRRENSPRRGAPRRRARSILVLCGGERTEPDYLDGLRRAYRRSGLKVRVVGKARDPEGLVRLARDILARERGEWDEVWCVVDVDQFDVTAAGRAAGRIVMLAVSNPCFEVWLLLHFETCNSHVDGAGDAVRRLAKHRPGYDKTRLTFADYAAGVETAIGRARILDDGGVTGPNPSSGMWRLVERIVRDTD